MFNYSYNVGLALICICMVKGLLAFCVHSHVIHTHGVCLSPSSNGLACFVEAKSESGREVQGRRPARAKNTFTVLLTYANCLRMCASKKASEWRRKEGTVQSLSSHSFLVSEERSLV